MTLRGIFAGALALVALEAVLHADDGAEKVGGALSAIAVGVRWVLDPTVPAIPDLAGVGDPSW
jgi:hypothetical protein